LVDAVRIAATESANATARCARARLNA
jgi:hypothetical protein